ncbi:hypothetical protein NQZ68_017486 [Dissostichus eleginoides]|nr:hypothetical protein NQZ68_017486 [Dissostichus eleginoides]
MFERSPWVYFAKQHLRHRDLMFISLWEVLGYSEATVLPVHCRKSISLSVDTTFSCFAASFLIEAVGRGGLGGPLCCWLAALSH